MHTESLTVDSGSIARSIAIFCECVGWMIAKEREELQKTTA